MNRLRTNANQLVSDEIHAILFDWHGVLDRTRFEDVLKKCSDESGLPMERVRSVFAGEARKYTRGEIPDEQFWEFVSEVCSLSTRQVQSVRTFVLAIDWNEPLWHILPSLKKKYKLVILSDCPIEKAQKIRKSQRLSTFDEVLLSAEVHLDKKMKEFFFTATKRLTLPPQECLFVDDSEKNTQFAKSIGFQVHIFQGTDLLKSIVL